MLPDISALSDIRVHHIDVTVVMRLGMTYVVLMPARTNRRLFLFSSLISASRSTYNITINFVICEIMSACSMHFGD